MSVSRRKFVKAGILATICAPLVSLKSALAEIGPKGPKTPAPRSPEVQPPAPLPSSSSSASIEQLSYYTRTTFDPYVNTRFHVYLGPSNTRGLKLAEVSDYFTTLSQQSAALTSSGDECFSLLFTIPPGKPFTQDTYLIEHDALGTFYMFVVPVGGHGKQNPDFYEAIIYRRQQFVEGQEPTIVTENQRTVTEQDVFKFRPVTTDSPAIAGKTKGADTQARAIYPLTMAQSPGINGLRLGMTPEQVLALFPGSERDDEVRANLDRPASPFGESSFIIRPAKYSSASKFDRISQIIFTLLDGRVSTLCVGYNGQVWEDVDASVTKFSKEKSLPIADSWEAYTGLDTQLKTLKCKDFEISLFAGGKNLSVNYVQMTDLVAQQKLKARRAKAKTE